MSLEHTAEFIPQESNPVIINLEAYIEQLTQLTNSSLETEMETFAIECK